MATLAATIQIHDRMSNVINSITNSLNICISNFESLQATTNKSFNTTNFSAARREMARAGADLALLGEEVRRFNGATITAPHMNVASANSGYQQLSATIDTIGRQIRNKAASQNDFNNNVQSGLSATISLAGKITAIAAALTGVVRVSKDMMRLSDTFSQNEARLNLINDGFQSTAQLQNMVFASAQRTGSEYNSVTKTVARLGVLAKNAFSNNAEIIAFAEQMNKQFAIGGSSIQEQTAAMYQLTQAMASGRLQGDEFRSIIENAPLLAESIAKFTGKSANELRQMSRDGLITAGVIKGALFAAAAETNERFAKMPVTFEQVFTMMSNTVNKAFEPVFQVMGSIANNRNLHNMIERIYPALAAIGSITANVINNIIWLAGIIKDNLIGVTLRAFTNLQGVLTGTLDILGGVIPYAIGLLAGYALYWTIVNAAMLYNSAITAINAIWQGILAAKTWAVVAAKAAWAGIMLLAKIALFALYLTVLLFTNPLYLIAALVGVVIAVFVVWGIRAYGLRNIIADVFGGIVDLTENMVNKSIGFINMLISAYNGVGRVLGKIFKFDFVAEKHIEFRADFSGYKNKWQDSIRNGTVIQDATNKIKSFLPEIPKGQKYDFSSSTTFDPSNAETAANTKGIKEAMGILDEDIKYLRDIADREYISNVSYSTVKIDMSGMTTNVNNKGDLDGLVDGLGQYIQERISIAAEGVHS